ncbi:MAG: Flp pilus assembly protein CpaB [Steroidobacter sp.]
MKGTLTTALMIGGALAAGGAAAYFADGYIDKTVSARRAELDAQYQPVRVVVANADLRPGVFLSGQSVAIREVPRAFLHSEAVLADSWSSIAGRVLARGLRSGEPVLMSHLAQSAGAGFSSQLAEGMRALTFPVDEEASISGMLAPADRIDIFFTTTSGNETVTLPLLLNVPVIATGIRTVTNESYLSEREQPGQYRTVTVSVSPDDAARITLAQDAGKITITLRQPQDDAPIQIARVTKNTLLHGDRVARAGAPRRRVEIILGGT